MKKAFIFPIRNPASRKRIGSGRKTVVEQCLLKGFADCLMPLVRWFMPPAYALACCWYAWVQPSRTTAAVAVWHKDKILLVTHSYKNGYSLPGGGMRRHEAPEYGAARELLEETGIEIEPATLRLADVSTRMSRYGKRKTYLFEVQLDDVPQIHVNGWEITTGSLVDAREACVLGRSADLRRYIEKSLVRKAT
ncbi:MAG TPA: NUDIX hydrolase [Nitrosomonas sp.]|nr:NUDIX hydrolase [Nitrosomonas sp.]